MAGESEPARKVSAAPPTGVDVLELGGLWNRLRPTRSLLDLAILDWGAAKESPDVLLILRACVTKSQANHYEPIKIYSISYSKKCNWRSKRFSATTEGFLLWRKLKTRKFY